METKIKESNKKTNDQTLFKDIASRIKSIKLNLAVSKRLAKELSIEEKKAMTWQTLEDVFACIDTSSLADNHPEEAAKVLRIVGTVVGKIFPVTDFIISKVKLCNDDVLAKIVKYCGMPTPEHMAHILISKEAKKSQNILENKMKDGIEVDLKEETK